MPFFPGARVDLLPEATTQTSIVPRLVILHTNAGGSSTTGYQLRAFMFRGEITLECHFQIDLDGTVHQYMPITVRADCNAAANPFAVSIETQDLGGATVDVTPWTPAQCAAIVNVLHWLHDTAGIPLERCTRWDGTGVAAHRDFPQWSAAAHSCPGVARVAQVPGLIAAAAAVQPIEEKGHDMPYCVDALTGKFWLIYFDGYGNRVACPLNETPDPDWDEYDEVQAAFGPLVPVPHAALQRLYDKRGRPQLPPTGGTTKEHVHANIGQPTTTGGVVP